MPVQDAMIEKVRTRLKSWPCPYCGSLRYYVIVRIESRTGNGGLAVRCLGCDNLRGIVMDTQSFWVKPLSVAGDEPNQPHAGRRLAKGNT